MWQVHSQQPNTGTCRILCLEKAACMLGFEKANRYFSQGVKYFNKGTCFRLPAVVSNCNNSVQDHNHPDMLPGFSKSYFNYDMNKHCSNKAE